MDNEDRTILVAALVQWALALGLGLLALYAWRRKRAFDKRWR
jgi:hypothetical protein